MRVVALSKMGGYTSFGETAATPLGLQSLPGAAPDRDADIPTMYVGTDNVHCVAILPVGAPTRLPQEIGPGVAAAAREIARGEGR